MPIKKIQFYSILCFLIICCLSSASHSKNVTSKTSEISYSQLSLDIKEFIYSKLKGKYQGRLDIRLSGFDERFGIKSCDKPLHYSLPSYSNIASRINITVNCQGQKQWHMLLPLQLKIFKPIVVTTRHLTRNEIIQREALAIVDADILSMTQGYFDNIEDIIGLVVDRPLRAGHTVTPSHVTPQTLVKRGEIVRLTANTKGIIVNTHAKAMEDGKLGDSIQVKNNRSSKTVQAVVTGAQTVEVF